MNTMHGPAASAAAGPFDRRFVWRVLLAVGGFYVAMRLARGLGRVFWTLVGLGLAAFWMLNGRVWAG